MFRGTAGCLWRQTLDFSHWKKAKSSFVLKRPRAREGNINFDKAVIPFATQTVRFWIKCNKSFTSEVFTYIKWSSAYNLRGSRSKNSKCIISTFRNFDLALKWEYVLFHRVHHNDSITPTLALERVFRSFGS